MNRPDDCAIDMSAAESHSPPSSTHPGEAIHFLPRGNGVISRGDGGSSRSSVTPPDQTSTPSSDTCVSPSSYPSRSMVPISGFTSGLPTIFSTTESQPLMGQNDKLDKLRQKKKRNETRRNKKVITYYADNSEFNISKVLEELGEEADVTAASKKSKKNSSTKNSKSDSNSVSGKAKSGKKNKKDSGRKAAPKEEEKDEEEKDKEEKAVMSASPSHVSPTVTPVVTPAVTPTIECNNNVIETANNDLLDGYGSDDWQYKSGSDFTTVTGKKKRKKREANNNSNQQQHGGYNLRSQQPRRRGRGGGSGYVASKPQQPTTSSSRSSSRSTPSTVTATSAEPLNTPSSSSPPVSNGHGNPGTDLDLAADFPPLEQQTHSTPLNCWSSSATPSTAPPPPNEENKAVINETGMLLLRGPPDMAVEARRGQERPADPLPDVAAQAPFGKTGSSGENTPPAAAATAAAIVIPAVASDKILDGDDSAAGLEFGFELNQELLRPPKPTVAPTLDQEDEAIVSYGTTTKNESDADPPKKVCLTADPPKRVCPTADPPVKAHPDTFVLDDRNYLELVRYVSGQWQAAVRETNFQRANGAVVYYSR